MEAAKKVATDLKNELDKVELDLVKKVGANGTLFGTVTTNELSKLLAAKGLEVARRTISLTNPIKSVGEYEAIVKLFSGVEATFKVKVTMDPKQEEQMKKKAAEAVERKAAREKEKAEALAAGETEKGKEEVPKTEDQLLSEEAGKILRD